MLLLSTDSKPLVVCLYFFVVQTTTLPAMAKAMANRSKSSHLKKSLLYCGLREIDISSIFFLFFHPPPSVSIELFDLYTTFFFFFKTQIGSHEMPTIVYQVLYDLCAGKCEWFRKLIIDNCNRRYRCGPFSQRSSQSYQIQSVAAVNIRLLPMAYGHT